LRKINDSWTGDIARKIRKNIYRQRVLRQRTRTYDRQLDDRLRRASFRDNPGHPLAGAARYLESRCFTAPCPKAKGR